MPRAGLLAQRVIRFFLTVLQRIKQENTAEVTSGRAEEVEQMDPSLSVAVTVSEIQSSRPTSGSLGHVFL